MGTSPQFAFLHVGPDAERPALLVASLRRFHPEARIVHCADRNTPPVRGVDAVQRCDEDPAQLMSMRLSAFAELRFDTPTLFMDTDMLCVAPIDPSAALGAAEVAVCRREYRADDEFLADTWHIDLSEYKGMMLGEVYPYVACATIAKSPAFWKDCLEELTNLDPKFERWFGDQEAIRNLVRSGRYTPALLSEAEYGRLPEYLDGAEAPPKLIHFKGAARKQQMREMAKAMRIA
jgi:hypothetical protein